ncbi:MAG: four helix bundle protein [Nitrospirota bacterium]
MHNFRNLKVYQRTIDFTVEIYKITRKFPREELWGLTSQIRRAVTSISLNIAEGSGNKSSKEFLRFLEIALRSDYEVITCLEIAKRLGYCSEEDIGGLSREADEIAAMLVGLMKSLEE